MKQREHESTNVVIEKTFDKLINNIDDTQKKEKLMQRRNAILKKIESEEIDNPRLIYNNIYKELFDYLPKIDLDDIKKVILEKLNWLSDQPIDSAWYASIVSTAVLEAETNLNLKIDEKTKKLAQNCVSWLIDKNNRTYNLLWSSGYNKGITNIFDTSFALIALIEREKAEPDLIYEASRYIKSQLIKEYGGWSPIPGENIDTGATSWAIIALLAAGENKFSKYIKLPEEWLFRNQRDDGGWSVGYKDDPQAKSVIVRTYDAVEALLKIGVKPQSLEIKKTVKWINGLQKLVNEKCEWGRGWESDYFPGTNIYQSDLENTATAIMILLICGQDPTSLEIIAGIGWLLKRVDSWNKTDTPRIIICLSLYYKLKLP
jgi:hypothetical protein